MPGKKKQPGTAARAYGIGVAPGAGLAMAAPPAATPKHLKDMVINYQELLGRITEEKLYKYGAFFEHLFKAYEEATKSNGGEDVGTEYKKDITAGDALAPMAAAIKALVEKGGSRPTKETKLYAALIDNVRSLFPPRGSRRTRRTRSAWRLWARQ